MEHVGETFQERLLRLIDERELTDTAVYKRANLDRKLFSKIRCNPDYRPRKRTAVALAIALELNLDETVDLLSRAELALSPSSKFDLILQFCLYFSMPQNRAQSGDLIRKKRLSPLKKGKSRLPVDSPGPFFEYTGNREKRRGKKK